MATNRTEQKYNPSLPTGSKYWRKQIAKKTSSPGRIAKALEKWKKWRNSLPNKES